MTRIIIVDDHPVVRAGLKTILSGYRPAFVVDESATGQDALELIRNNRYDAVVLDISLKNENGLEVLKRIKRFRPKLPVLMLSVYNEEEYALRAFSFGASGYLNKCSVKDELQLAVAAVIQGRKYITPGLAENLLNRLEKVSTVVPHRALSDKEFEIFLLLAQGLRPKDIGSQLSISSKTVSTHKARILKKMKMDSIAELARYAAKEGLIL